MNKRILLSLATVGLLSVGAGAHAQTAAESISPQSVPAPLQLALQGGLKLERKFEAAGGMTGWILSEGPGRNMVVFTSSDGEVAIAGNMLDAKGQNLTAKYLDQYAPKVDYGKFWNKLEQSAYVAEGAKGKDVKSVIYVFKDPNCSYCHLAWKAFQPYQKVGLQVRWVLVSFLGRDTENKSAALLTSKDPAATLATLHAEFGKPSSLSTTPVSADIKAKLAANNRLMGEMGFRGTPATLYKDKDGKVKAADGMPRANMLPVITGLPEQPLPADIER